MRLLNKKILITGADGFIGSHLTEKLIKKGCKVKAFVLYNSFNTYSPRQSLRAVIPTLITPIARGNKEIKLGALSPTRDFNFVDDITEVFIKIAESDNTIGKTLNADSNYEISSNDTARTIAQLMDKKIEIISGKERIRPEKSEINRLWADNTNPHVRC